MKKCSKCDELKDEDEFYRKRNSRHSHCKVCHIAMTRRYQGSVRGREVIKAYRQTDSSKMKRRAWAQSDKGRECQRKSEQKCRPRKMPSVSPEVRRELAKSKRRAYERRRLAANPSIRIGRNVSSAVNKAIKSRGGSKMGQSTFKYLPYTPQQLMDHLESLWEPWMNWDNYGHGRGKWTIDHIIPQSALPYDSMDHPNFQPCWALSNLQPMEFIANIRKGGRAA